MQRDAPAAVIGLGDASVGKKDCIAKEGPLKCTFSERNFRVERVLEFSSGKLEKLLLESFSQLVIMLANEGNVCTYWRTESGLVVSALYGRVVYPGTFASTKLLKSSPEYTMKQITIILIHFIFKFASDWIFECKLHFKLN